MRGHAPRVLIVTTDEPMQELYRVYLTRQGYRVSTASSALTALQRLKDDATDLLLTSWHLAGVPGDALVLEAKRRQPSLRAVLMCFDDAVERAARECGADGGYVIRHELQSLGTLVAHHLGRPAPARPHARSLAEMRAG